MAEIHSAGWAGFSQYDDIGMVMELAAVFGDTLKTDETFMNFAVMVAQRIAEETDAKARITVGKWGARIEPDLNQHLDGNGIRGLAYRIIRHPSWVGLCLATWVFTYGAEADGSSK